LFLFLVKVLSVKLLLLGERIAAFRLAMSIFVLANGVSYFIIIGYLSFGITNLYNARNKNIFVSVGKGSNDV